MGHSFSGQGMHASKASGQPTGYRNARDEERERELREYERRNRETGPEDWVKHPGQNRKRRLKLTLHGLCWRYPYSPGNCPHRYEKLHFNGDKSEAGARCLQCGRYRETPVESSGFYPDHGWADKD